MRATIVVILLSLTACAHAPPPPPPKVEVKAEPAAPAPETPPAELYAQARGKMAAREFSEARSLLEAFLAKEPGSAAGHFDAGWVAEQLQNATAARAHYIKALAAEPEHLGAALNLARLHRQAERYDDAARVLEGALEKRPGDPRLLNARAAALRLQKKLGEAEQVVQQILLRHPKDADAYKNLALIETDRGRTRLAELALANARKLDAKDAGIVNNLGLLALRRDDVAAARERFLEATKIDPKLGAAWANLGAIALQYRDYAAAAEAYAKAVEILQGRADLHLAYAWALEGTKKPALARAEFEKVLAARPDDQDALYGRALALKAEGNLPESMKAFQVYVALPKAAKLKDAQSQIAQIDMRMKAAPLAKPAVAAKKDAQGAADLSQLPVGKDEEGGSALPALPSLEEDDDEKPAAQASAPAKADKPKAEGGGGDAAVPEPPPKEEPKKEEPVKAEEPNGAAPPREAEQAQAGG